MRKILLGLGAVSVMAVPAVVAVSCNEDTTVSEYSKLADAARNATKTFTVMPVENNGTYNRLITELPASFGLSTPEVLDKVEASVRTHFDGRLDEDGQNPWTGSNFTIGTYGGTDTSTDTHIEMTLTDGLMTEAQLRTFMNEIINFIATIK